MSIRTNKNCSKERKYQISKIPQRKEALSFSTFTPESINRDSHPNKKEYLIKKANLNIFLYNKILDDQRLEGSLSYYWMLEITRGKDTLLKDYSLNDLAALRLYIVEFLF